MSGDFREIGLAKVLWKSISSLLEHQLTAAITFHDVLHGFRAGCGAGSAALEDNLIQQLMVIREAVHFEVLMDLHKAYDTLDQDICLKILTLYVVGPWALQLLRTYWDRLTMIARASGYFGLPFKG